MPACISLCLQSLGFLLVALYPYLSLSFVLLLVAVCLLLLYVTHPQHLHLALHEFVMFHVVMCFCPVVSDASMSMCCVSFSACLPVCLLPFGYCLCFNPCLDPSNTVWLKLGFNLSPSISVNLQFSVVSACVCLLFMSFVAVDSFLC